VLLSLVVYLIPYLLGIVLLISLIGAYANFRRARKAPYFRIRRASAQRGWQWVLILIVCLASIIVATFARRYVPPFNFGTLLPPTSTPTPEIPVSATPDSGQPPAPPLDIPPTITPTQPAPPITPTPVFATIESEVTIPPGATLSISAISSGISPSRTPVNPSTTFPAGTQRLYFWLEFSGMLDGASWSQALLLNGSVVRSESEAWGQGAEGTSFYWFEAQGGWPAGSYEIRFYLGDTLAASETFSIID
jgi:hypothetical protein